MSRLIRYVNYPFFKGDTADISSMVSGRFHFMAHLLVLPYVFILLFCHLISLGGYNHGPCGCDVGFVTLCLLF